MKNELRTNEPYSREERILPSADLAVVVCSLNGAAGVHRCLDALFMQTIQSRLEVVVVDDGSTDDTSEVASAHGTIVVRHPVNRGLAAARNSGLRAASAPIVAFLDDDCEPEPEWAEQLISGYGEGVIGVGGPVLPNAPNSFIAGYLKRHNPLRPLELNLTKSDKLSYRFYLYLKRLWADEEAYGQRDVYAFVGANMSFRRQAVIDAGWFDERFRFGGEEGDLCHTLSRVFPSFRLVFKPEARVVHHFEPSLRDMLRRSRSYGVGSARLYRKWPSMRPTFFPWPVLVLALLVSSVAFPLLAAVALAAPQVLYPRSLRTALSQRRTGCLLDAYLQLTQEACGNIGFLHGLWIFRHFLPQSPNELAKAASEPAVELEKVP
jgi:glycosyltransferase involved in cell wall biosynthesis